MDIPAALNSQRRLGDDWAHWLDRLPRLCDDLLDEWALTSTGDPMHGFASIVLPVRGSIGDAVLKIGFDGSPETRQEHLALQHWAGDGAVQMLRADPRRRALLLERLHEQDLSQEWDLQACEIVADLYRQLHRPAPPRLARLTDFLGPWIEALDRDAADIPMPPRLVEQALARGRAFVDDPASDGVMIHGDLHYENVLAADRQPWLAIDPQPMSGDPHYEIAPLLWNRWDEMSGYLRESIQRRFYTTVEAAGFDGERARDWVIVRMVLNTHWAVADAKRMRRDLTDDERAWITTCISVIKGVQR
ncbi:aminoglycoside phosphotransferase family protein [Gordonia liuliyuniae]|uniref:Aminoglycoside phosphotransferase family protein n=1 Tax=Gordonia liuliyuniae TaxID=2911517 RepID=A0ABS9IY47_9ACTN|nr:aminoglycoside phosphotransferase family protein [Gordonia liuliyuniae]MCF8590497.1 aminoglycoside phosphotransferase family protein [Gordonia liuliyuniae]